MRTRQYLGVLLLIGISSVAGAVVGSRIATADPNQSQVAKAVEVPKLQEWEYRVVDAGGANNAEKAANRLGADGFELLNFKITGPGLNYHLAFSRPKPP